jgi:hypothetical protein
MSDPVSGTSVAAGGLMGASMFGLATGIDYGVVFGAFAGAVFTWPRQLTYPAESWWLTS